MDLCGEKKNAARTVMFLCTIMLVLMIADLLPQKLVSFGRDKETNLSIPVPVKEAVNNGSFMREYEVYAKEAFVSKENWEVLCSHLEILRGVKEINGVYLGKDDYLIEKHTKEEFQADAINKSVENMQKLIKEFPQTKLLAVPTADNIMSEQLPAFAPFYDQRLLLEQLKNELGKERIIDIYDILKEHAQEPIYYRTDREWTTLGAYYGYQAFAKTYHLPAVQYLKKEPVTVTEEFRGDLYNKTERNVKPEEILMFPATLDKKYTITYDGEKTTNSFYEESYLAEENKLGYFLDGDHALTRIERESFSQKRLFVIKDGFGESLIPLLAPHYKYIYVVDLSCYNDKLIDFMKECDENGDMDVLVLYDCATFVESFRVR